MERTRDIVSFVLNFPSYSNKIRKMIVNVWWVCMHDYMKVCIYGEKMIRHQARLALCMVFLHYINENLCIHIYTIITKCIGVSYTIKTSKTTS